MEHNIHAMMESVYQKLNMAASMQNVLYRAYVFPGAYGSRVEMSQDDWNDFEAIQDTVCNMLNEVKDNIMNLMDM